MKKLQVQNSFLALELNNHQTVWGFEASINSIETVVNKNYEEVIHLVQRCHIKMRLSIEAKKNSSKARKVGIKIILWTTEIMHECLLAYLGLYTSVTISLLESTVPYIKRKC